MGKYTPAEATSECFPCEKPLCAKNVSYCNPITGLEQSFTFYDPFEALSVACGPPADPDDPCSAPRTCVAGAAQCSAQNVTHPLVLVGNMSGEVQIDGGGWGGVNACPSIHRGPNSTGGGAPACWDQFHTDRFTARRRSDLHYSSTPGKLTAVVPPTLVAMCGGAAVTPRYQFFVIACREGASECSDEAIDCPSSADLGTRWWEAYAQTIAESTSPLDGAYGVHGVSSFTTALPLHMASRTAHVLVHVWGPAGSPATKAESLMCLSRTKFDETPPIAPADAVELVCDPAECHPAAARASVPSPSGMRPLLFSPSTAELHMRLASFGQGTSPVESCAPRALPTKSCPHNSHRPSLVRGLAWLGDAGQKTCAKRVLPSTPRRCPRGACHQRAGQKLHRGEAPIHHGGRRYGGAAI
jgi:hypothetical protein